MADTKMVSKLRAMTGAPMGDCAAALEESGGDIEKAREILRKKGSLKAGKRALKAAREGAVVSYIHAGSKIGVIAELNCETDFVARSPQFQELAKDIAMHIAAADPLYVSRADVPSEILEKEKEIYRGQLEADGSNGKKPAAVLEKIIEGKLEKFFSDVCLMDQQFIKDETKTVGELLNGAVQSMGEKISVRRFTRYELGEGMMGGKADFAAEVKAQLNT